MGTTRFFIRTEKPDKNGKVSIQLVYQISKKRERFQTKEKIWPQCWDQDNQSVKFYSSKRELTKLSVS
jgi:hypothetical protein